MFALLCSLALASTPDFLAWQADRAPATVPSVADGYRFADGVWADVAGAIEAHPDRVAAEEIGRSVAGRPIWAFHAADPAAPVEHRVLVFAGIHALEWISTEVATDLLREWIALPPPGIRLTVIPILNPDGRERVELDLIGGVHRYRRGNLAQVDLNRDFAVHTEARAVWRHLMPGRYAHSETPLSQPESRALDALVARDRPKRAASLHAFGGFLYYPWSGRWARPDNHAEIVRLGRAMEQAQGSGAYRTRQLSRWGFFFRAQGSEIDHLYGRYDVDAFLVELTRSGARPLHALADWRIYFRRYNPVDPAPHVARGVAAMRALATTAPWRER